MSWFTELAGRAEEFLNKVDKGAATALSGEANKLLPIGSHASGRSGSTSSEPLGQPSPKLVRKGSSPDLTRPKSAASRETLSGSPRATSSHKKTLSNASYTAATAEKEQNDEALLEFLNAPSAKIEKSSELTREASTASLRGMTENADESQDAQSSGEGEKDVIERGSVPVPKASGTENGLDAAGENSLLRNEIQSLNQEINQLFYKLKSNEKEVKKLRQDLDREKENGRRYASKLREKDDRENDITQMLEAKDSQVSVLKVRLAEAEEKLRVTDSQLQATLVENERILQASTESSSFQNTTVESLRKQVEDLESALSSEREAARLRNLEHVRMITELEESQASLSASIAAAENRAEVQAQIAEKRRQDVALADSRVEQAQRELSDYKQKAQRILQSKEKLISTLKSNNRGGDAGDGGNGDSSESMEMEQLRQERDLLREESGKQQAILDMLKVQMNDLEAGHQNALSAAQEQLRYQNESLEEERSRTRELQAQCTQLNDELVFLREDLTQQKVNFAAKIQDRDVEIEKLRKQLMAKKMSSASQAEVETRLQALTQNLIQKQTLIEQLTTEKSALAHQVERMERHRGDSLTFRSNGGQDTYLTINSTDDAKAHIPSFMVESPMDGRMARRVKRVYSTLDTFSIRLGVFLRRFPVARVMVLAYMGLLHLWVMIVLLTYQPEIHDSGYEASFHVDRDHHSVVEPNQP